MLSLMDGEKREKTGKGGEEEVRGGDGRENNGGGEEMDESEGRTQH